MTITYPNSIDSFTTKHNVVAGSEDITGDVIQAEHINSLQEAVVAIETAIGATPQGDFVDVGRRIKAIENSKALSTTNFCIYYGNPLKVNEAANYGEAAAQFMFYEYIIFKGIEDSTHDDYYLRRLMVQLVQKNNRAKCFSTIDCGVSYPHPNYSVAQIHTVIDKCVTIGLKGILLSNFGFDSGVTRERQNAIMALVHAHDLNAVVDCDNHEHVFGTTYNETYNPNYENPLISEDDIYIHKSFVVDTSSGPYVGYSVVKAKADSLISYRQSFRTKLFGLSTIASNTTITLAATYFNYGRASALLFSYDAYYALDSDYSTTDDTVVLHPGLSITGNYYDLNPQIISRNNAYYRIGPFGKLTVKPVYNTYELEGTTVPGENISGNIDVEALTQNVIEAVNTNLGATIEAAKVDKLTIDHIKDMVISAINSSTETFTISSSKIDTLEAVEITAERLKSVVVSAINLYADEMTVDSATIDTAAIGNLSASKITTGDLIANVMKTNVVSAVNAYVDTLTTEQINAGVISASAISGKVVDAIALYAGTATIDGAIMKSASIDGAKIKNASITNAQINDLSASKINTGTVNTQNINITSNTAGTGARIDFIGDSISLYETDNTLKLQLTAGTGINIYKSAGIRLSDSGSIKFGNNDDIVLDINGLKAKAGSNTYTNFFNADGIQTVDPSDSNRFIVIKKGEIQLTKDGGATIGTAMTADGFYGQYLTDYSIAASKFDTTPPAIPTWRDDGVISVVEQEANTTIVCLIVKWTEVSDADLEGYKVYLKEDTQEVYYPVAITGKTNQYKIRAVKPNTSYSVIVSSFDQQGNECSLAEPPLHSRTTYPIHITSQGDQIAPSHPTGLVIQNGFKMFGVKWNTVTTNVDSSVCNDLDHYIIKRAYSGDNYTTWTSIASIKSNSYIDKNVEYEFEYKYCVSAVDTSGNISASSSILMAGSPSRIGADDIVAHAITADHISVDGFDAAVITSGRISGEFIEGGTISADKFENEFYGDLSQAMNYVKGQLSNPFYEWTSNSATSRWDEGTHYDTTVYDNILTLDYRHQWDESNLTWNQDSVIWNDIQTEGYWESNTIDLTALETVLVSYKMTAVIPQGASIKVYFKYSENNSSWSEYDYLLSNVIYCRYLKLKIALSMGEQSNVTSVNSFTFSCFREKKVQRAIYEVPSGGIAQDSALTIPDDITYLANTNKLFVYRQGLKQCLGKDYTEYSNGTQVKFNYDIPADDILEFVVLV